VKLNDVGKENQLLHDLLDNIAPSGEIELWLDGASVLCVKDLLLCDSDEGRIKGVHFQTFFGGSDS